MTRNYTKTSIFKAIAVTVVVVSCLFSVAPKTTHAFNIIDPFCLWSGCGDDDHPKNVTNNYNNANNTGNINSSGGTVVNGNVSTGGTGTTVVPVTYPYPVPVPTPTYPPYPYPYPQPNYPSPLSVSCYASPTYARVGESVMWGTSISGGNNNYYVTWSGSDGLSGYGTTLSKVYYAAGSKTASVTVTSAGQTISRNCDTTIQVTGYNNYDYNYNYNYNYNNNYDYNYNYNYPLTVTCTANVSFAPIGTNVQWSASVSGGSYGSYSYQWRGTDGLYGSGQYANISYNTSGPKYAGVTVYSGGQSITRDCTNSVLVGTPNNGGNNIQVACFADKVTARIGEPVTWAVEAANASNYYGNNNYYGNFTYSWTGSEGMYGSGQTLHVTYNSLGQKTATVTVYSGNAIVATQMCGNSVNIVSATTSYKPPVKKPVAKAQSSPKIVIYNNVNSNPANSVQPVVTYTTSTATTSAYAASSVASSFFSIQGFPWGWVSILVIVVLFGMVIYLFVNRNEIN